MENLKFFRNKFNLTQKQLAEKLSIEQNTIMRYENNIVTPSFKKLKEIVNFFGITYDYFFHADDCFYPRNLIFLHLAKKLDHFSHSDLRSNVETTTKSLLGENINNDLPLKYDNIDIDLSNSFNVNLKKLRQLKNIKQNELAEVIQISRSLLAMYEKNKYPHVSKLINLSNKLNISIHALVTGEKLHFKFADEYFGKTMLLADHFLSLEHQKFIIELMVNLTKTQPAQS